MTRNVTKTTLCSTLAIATAMVMAPRPAAAQAFIGTVTSSTGVSAPVNGATTTFINVTAPQAVINWDATGAASGGVVTFQGSGTTATFSSGGADFAVLNRVNASGNAIKLDGAINSQVGDSVGGTVYFSSADGIIVGKNAVINVGSLGLTTLPIADDGLGNWMTGFGGAAPQVTFGAAGNVFSFIKTEGGAQLKANGSGNYVALVAPKITHSGTILTDGGAALVGANAATITFSNSNLYTIQVDAPSGAFNAVTVDGGKINANVGSAADRQAYLVTMAPNDTNTILITGGANLGFAAATTASSVGNAVVLSAGGGVYSGTPTWDANNFGNVTIDGATITSDFTALGKDGVTVSNATGATAFSDDVHLFTHGGDINIASTTGTLLFAGNLTADVSLFGSSGQTVLGQTVNVSADGSAAAINVVGATYLGAAGYGGNGNSDSIGGSNGTGGTIEVDARNGGHIDFQSDLTANANGQGGYANFGGTAGSGTGGSIFLGALTGTNSRITIGGLTNLQVDGFGSGANDCGNCGVTGGIGQGGNVSVQADGAGNNLIEAGGLFYIDATGVGGSARIGGDGLGGTVAILATGGAVLNLRSPTAYAIGQGGQSNSGSDVGGAGVGGFVTLSVGFGSTGDFQGDILLVTDGLGGDGASGGGGGGGFSQIFNSGNFSVSRAGDFPGTVNLSSVGRGGSASTGNGGVGSGGTSVVRTTNADMTLDAALQLQSNGFGGTAQVEALNGGAGHGGVATLYADGGTISVGEDTQIHADGSGGGAQAAGQSGGNGTGGLARAEAHSGGTISFAKGGNVYAAGYGGSGEPGGTGTGGEARVYSFETSLVGTGAGSGLTVNADGIGGSGGYYTGNGGNGFGGSVTLLANVGTVITDQLNLSANGNGSSGNASGSGTGGNVSLRAFTGGQVLAAGASLSADGQSNYAYSDTSGSGQGGQVSIASGAASLLSLLGSTYVSANGYGGTTNASVGTGAGLGGSVLVNTYGGTITFGDYASLAANGFGGSSNGDFGTGGLGQGGTVSIQMGGGHLDGATTMSLSANGRGGFVGGECYYCGGTGAVGIGGTAIIDGGAAGNSITLGAATTISATGRGTSGGGGTGGAGGGGNATLQTNGGTISGGAVTIDASA